MKALRYFVLLFILLAVAGRPPAAAQLGFDIDIKKPAPYENRKLKAEKSGTKKFNTPRRILQNTYTHYNYFFNANNKLNEVIARAKEFYKEDYSKLLPFYNYQLSVTAQDKGELDSVIYKSKTGVLMHDLRNDWIDDMYLLWGQAYYLQEQYDSAYQMFQFINYSFADKEADGYYKYIGSRMDGGGANRIASDEKMTTVQKLTAEAPARNNALLWEVRSLIGAGAMVESGSLLAALRNDPMFPERLREHMEEVQALWFYRQERWDSAAHHLKIALNNAPTKQERARWEYLAAQLFEKSMQPEEATALYTSAISHTIDPVLELYARLNLIRINKAGGENYIDQNIAALLKMAKRDKYVDYRDAIYYTAGEMELARFNYSKAQEYFLKAAKYKTEESTTAQRGFLQLANLYFEQKAYTQAARFYDSVQLNNPTEEETAQLAKRKDLLAGLLNQLGVVTRHDSLQRIAALPEKERTDYIKKLARQLRRQRGLADETATTNNNPAADNLPSRQNADLFTAGGGTGEWYFYNKNTRTQGEAAFKRIWGGRPNVDNWRRSSDVVSDLQNQSIANTRGNPGQAVPDDAKAISFEGLSANLPLTDEGMQQSNDSIANALYSTGRMYTDGFEDYESAIKTYEEIRRRFPAFENSEEVLFQLYYSYTKTGNSAKAAEIKALLAEKYPQGHFTAIATTGKAPDADNDKAAATKAYEVVYDLFLEGKFNEAKEARRVADSLYTNTPWLPQLLYIEAVYNIKQGKDSAAKELLNNLVQQSGDAPLGQKAATLLDVLERRDQIEEELRNLQIDRPQEEKKVVIAEKKPPEKAPEEKQPEEKKPEEVLLEPQPMTAERTAGTATDTASKTPLRVEKAVPAKTDTLALKRLPPPDRPKVFTYQPEETHSVVILLNKVDVVFGNEAKNAFSRYNREKYYNRTFDLTVIPLNEDYKLLTIGAFANIQDAVDYLQRAKPAAASEIVPWLKKEKYRFSLISENNLLLLQKNGDLPGYETFLEKNLPVKF